MLVEDKYLLLGFAYGVIGTLFIIAGGITTLILLSKSE